MTNLTQKEIENRRNALRAARRNEQMKCRVTGTKFRRGDGRYVSADGIARLAEAGVASFEEATGHHMPHNLVRTAMSGAVGVVGPRGYMLSQEGANKQIESHARMGGWLVAAAGLPAVRKLLEKTQSSRGINSDYTYISLWNLVERFPSPGHLERKLWTTKIRAEGILSAFHGGIKPSWKNLGIALMGDARVGKAAVITAALQLGWDGSPTQEYATENGGRYIYTGPYARAKGYGHWPCSYRKAREWLIATRPAKIPNFLTEGIRYEAEPLLSEEEVCVYAGLQIGRFGDRSKVFVTIKGDKNSIAPEDHYDPQKAIFKATKEWQVYKEAEGLLVEKLSLHCWTGEVTWEWDEVSFDTELRLKLSLSNKKSFLIIRKEGIRDYGVYLKNYSPTKLYFPTKGKEEEFFWKIYNKSFKKNCAISGAEVMRFLAEPLGYLGQGVLPLDFREEIPESPKKILTGTVKIEELDLSELFE